MQLNKKYTGRRSGKNSCWMFVSSSKKCFLSYVKENVCCFLFWCFVDSFKMQLLKLYKCKKSRSLKENHGTHMHISYSIMKNDHDKFLITTNKSDENNYRHSIELGTRTTLHCNNNKMNIHPRTIYKYCSTHETII